MAKTGNAQSEESIRDLNSQAKPPISKPESNVEDLEIKDAQLIFDSVWPELEAEFGADGLNFPSEIFWLNGAPGAGKGTHTDFILKYRDFTTKPIVISDLLQTPEAKKMKDAGLLVGDKEVIGLLFRKLLEPQFKNGAIVDGFPRTKVQVECLKMLYHKLNERYDQAVRKQKKRAVKRPHFHIIVLFVEEAESVKRQLLRGQKAAQKNKEVQVAGVGQAEEVRKTDLSEDAARDRYRTFKEVTYDSLSSLREVFHYHFINAHGSIDEVQARIVKELQYQSTLELSEDTCDRLSHIPIASEIVVHARQELVRRLDDYERNHTELFARVVNLIKEKFMPIIERHAISGKAVVSSEDKIFEIPAALAMVIDIFSERGYHATVDVRREKQPRAWNLLGQIRAKEKRVTRFEVRFKGSEIRRGH